MKTSATFDRSQAAASKTRRTTMIDQLQSQQEQTATEDIAVSLEKSSQTVVDSLFAIQELHLEVAQNLLLSWMELLILPLRQSARQPAMYRWLLGAPMQPYVDWMLAPLTLSRKLVETSMTAMQGEREPERIP
jgi:hypothetical protein